MALISEGNLLEVKKRLKSFGWRTGMMVLAVAVDFLLQNYTLLNLPPFLVTGLGLALGEASKAVANKLK